MKRKQLEDITGGLFLMIIFTAVWILVAEGSLQGRDHWIGGVVFSIIIVYLIVNYNRLSKVLRGLTKDEKQADDPMEKEKTRRFYYIFAIEGIAIFAMRVILENTGHINLFFPFFGLIVGLHFFPLAKLFDREFYYAIGGWMCLVAIAGFIIAWKHAPDYVAPAIIGIGCGLATAMNGIRMIREGDEVMKNVN